MCVRLKKGRQGGREIVARRRGVREALITGCTSHISLLSHTPLISYPTFRPYTLTHTLPLSLTPPPHFPLHAHILTRFTLAHTDHTPSLPHSLTVGDHRRTTVSIPLVANTGRCGCGCTQLATSSSAANTLTGVPGKVCDGVMFDGVMV